MGRCPKPRPRDIVPWESHFCFAVNKPKKERKFCSFSSYNRRVQKRGSSIKVSLHTDIKQRIYERLNNNPANPKAAINGDIIIV